MRNRHFYWVGTSLGLLGLVGCASRGLSNRESGMQTYSQILDSAGTSSSAMRPADVPAFAGATGPVRVNFPTRVSVVQIGEIAPPESMLKTFRAHPELFTKVTPQTGDFDRGDQRYSQPQFQPYVDLPDGRRVNAPQQPEGPDRLTRMRNLASNLGSEYLLVFGGNIDSGHEQTGLSILDLTIVGAFVVPSNGVAVSGKSAGSLVEVSTGRVVMNFSADTAGHGMAPSAFAQNAETVAVENAKHQLVDSLATDVVKQMSEQAKGAVAIAH